jgi:hypothetical protein
VAQASAKATSIEGVSQELAWLAHRWYQDIGRSSSDLALVKYLERLEANLDEVSLQEIFSLETEANAVDTLYEAVLLPSDSTHQLRPRLALAVEP